MAKIPSISPNPCSEAAMMANWGRIADNFGKVISGPNDTSMGYLEDKVNGDDGLTEQVVVTNPDGTQTIQIIINNANSPVINYIATYSPIGIVWQPWPGGFATTNQEVVTDVRISAGKLQVYKKTLKVIEVVTDTGWVDVHTFASLGTVVRNVEYDSAAHEFLQDFTASVTVVDVGAETNNALITPLDPCT